MKTIALTIARACLMTMRPVTHTLNLMEKLSDGTVTTSCPCTPSPHTTTNDRTRCPLLTRLPSYHKTHSRDQSPASNATTPTTRMLYVPLLSRTSPWLWSYSTMMWEHQSTQRVMSPGLCLAQDSSLYDERQGHATPTRS